MGKSGLEEDDANPQQGGAGAAGVLIIFKVSGAGGANLQIGDPGDPPPNGQALGGFNAQVEKRLTGQLLWRTPDKKWIYNLAATAREEAGFLTM